MSGTPRRLGARPLLAPVAALVVALLVPAGGLIAQTTVTGTLNVIWGDPPIGRTGGGRFYLLTDDRGGNTTLSLSAAQIAAVGDPGAGVAVPVRVTLDTARLGGDVRRRIQASAIRSIAVLGGLTAQRSVTNARVGGVSRYLTILCRYADLPPSASPDRYRAMYLGTTPPGAAHYWNEASAGSVQIEGTVVGWYTLPGSHGDYTPNDELDFGRLLSDCLDAADADVHFPDFDGINIQVNGRMGCCSYGGPAMLFRDGQMARYRLTWMAVWADEATVAHEMGHGFGLNHSSGPYGQVYDSRWDVMSGGGEVQTIAHHKDVLGWIPAERSFIAPSGSSRTTVALADPLLRGQGNGYLIARIPIANAAGSFYTLEARRGVGYDSRLPAAGVIIHRVDVLGAYGDTYAYVVDADGNGNANDAGAVWVPGERFDDAANAISVSVDGQTASGYSLTITAGGAPSTFLVSATVVGTGGSIVGAGGGNPIHCPSECTGRYSTGTRVTLTSVPKPGFTFVGWEGGCSGKGSCELVMNGDRAVRATFVAGRTISVTVSGTGVVASSPEGIYCDQSCGAAFTTGSTVTMYAAFAAPGWYFAGWGGACSGTAFTCTLDLSQDRAVTVTYAKGGHTLTIQRSGAGLVTSSRGGLYCSDTYPSGCSGGFPPNVTVAFNAYPAPGWRLDAWGGPCAGSSGCSMTTPAGGSGSTIVTARFTGGIALQVNPLARSVTIADPSAGLSTDSVRVDFADGVAPAWTGRSTAPWVTLLTPTGTGTEWLRWQRNPTGLLAGLYVDTITVASSGVFGSPTLVFDSLQVGGTIAASTSSTSRLVSLAFGSADTRADSVAILLSGSGASSVAWTVTHRAGAWWNRIDTPRAAGSGTVRWTHVLRDIAYAGTFVDTIVVAVPRARGSPLVIVDTLRLSPVLTVATSIASRLDSVLVGSTTPRADSADVQLTGFRADTVRWTAVHGAGRWLTLTLAAGRGSGRVKWTRGPGGLSAGVYVDTIVIGSTAPPTPAVRMIDSLRVVEALTVVLSSQGRATAAVMGDVRAQPDSVTVSFTGMNAGAARWSASHGGGGGSASWLLLLTADGTGGEKLRWARNPTGLVAGTYVDTMVVSSLGTPSLSRFIDTMRVAEPIVVADCAVNDLLGVACLSAVERVYLDLAGNRDQQYDLGDLIALLDRTGGSLSAEMQARLMARSPAERLPSGDEHQRPGVIRPPGGGRP